MKDLLHWLKRALSGVGFIGMSLTVASFMLLDERGIVSRPVLIALQASALVTSSIYLAVSVACFEKQLIRSLAHRFELLFSAAQFVSASLLYSAMLRWDTSCLLVLTSVLWFVWILHVDALTPRLRRHLGFKKRHAEWALVALSICMLRVAASLVFDEANGYHDSILARFLVGSGVVLQFRTKSAFLNRMFPLSVWTLRMLWELMMRHEEELVFVRGTVEYFCPLEMLSVFHSSHVHPDDDAIGPSQGRASVLDMRIRSTS